MPDLGQLANNGILNTRAILEIATMVQCKREQECRAITWLPDLKESKYFYDKFTHGMKTHYYFDLDCRELMNVNEFNTDCLPALTLTVLSATNTALSPPKLPEENIIFSHRVIMYRINYRQVSH